MEFYELGSYKEQILKAITADEDITNFISPDCCLDLPYFPGVIPDGNNFIGVDSYIIRAGGTAIKEIGIDIYIMFPKNNMAITDELKAQYRDKGYSGNPIDIIIQSVGRLLNGSKDFGIGSLKPALENPVRSYIPEENPGQYHGKILSFACSDFMKDFRKVF